MTSADHSDKKLNKLSYLCLFVFIGCSGYLIFGMFTEKPVTKIQTADAEPFLGMIDGYGYFTKINETLTFDLIKVKVAGVKLDSNHKITEIYGYNSNNDYSIPPTDHNIMIDDVLTINQTTHVPICKHIVDGAESYPDGKPKIGVIYKDTNSCPSRYFTYNLESLSN